MKLEIINFEENNLRDSIEKLADKHRCVKRSVIRREIIELGITQERLSQLEKRVKSVCPSVLIVDSFLAEQFAKYPPKERAEQR
jgi:hypothetical protein